ncbi:MAG: type III-B CRISPR module RAMP protein Cmr6 [Candidatus Methanomethylicaceae archaeon]
MPNGRRRERTETQVENGPPPLRLPLPKDSQPLAEALHRQAQNIGLLFNKFIWIWDGAWTLEGKFKEGRRERRVKSWFLEQVEAIARHFPRDAYFAFIDRQVKMVESLKEHGHKTVIFGKQAEARILSGLGGPHPMEVGFAFHPLYGFPYLPGSGLKGAARAWAELTSQPVDKIKLVFGSESKDEHQAKEHQQGDVIFLDAYAIAPPRLEVDILNPHFPDYYREPEKNLPTEWQSPNPVNFITIGAGISDKDRPVFQFALVARSEEALQLGQEWLEGGLEHLGFGGKTASGYGYFAKGRVQAEELDKLRKGESAKIPAQEGPKIPASPPILIRRPKKKQKSPSVSLSQNHLSQGRLLTVKQGDKIDAEVISNVGGRVTVRLLQGLNQEISFDHAYYPHAPGKRVKVRILAVSSEGRANKVAPA